MQTPDANSRGKSVKTTVAPRESTSRPRQKQKGRNWPSIYCSSRAKSPARGFYRDCRRGRGREKGASEGRGREKGAGGHRAPLGCSSARVHRPAGPCRGAAPASPHLGSDGGSASPRTSGMKSTCSSPCYRRPSARVIVARPHLPASSLRRRPSAPARLPSKCVCRLCSGPLNLPAPCRLLYSGPLNLPAPCRLLCSGPCTLL